MRMRLTQSILVVTVLTGVAVGAVLGPPAAPRADLPGDKERRQEITATENGQEYTVDFRGTVDGVQTRMPISYHPYVQGWQPNVFARIENVGDTDVANPWITVNGRGDWRTLASMVEEATRGEATDAEKARALWEWSRTHRFHACTWDGEVSDAVKAFNVYGYTLCGDQALVLNDLWRAAGLHTRPGHPVGHSVVEALYDGAYHLLDGDEHVICLLRDNKTIASEADVVRDHDLMKRTHTYGISAPEEPLQDQFSASLYGWEGRRTGEWDIRTRHAMHFTLRPGEALEWRWSHVGKQYSAGVEMKPGEKWTTDGEGTLFTGWGQTAYDNLRNGKWIYRPPVDKILYRRGVQSEENMACAAEDGRKPNLHPAKVGAPATVTWRIASPYVCVGGMVQCEVRRKVEGDALRLRWSGDGKEWQDLARADRLGESTVSASLDKLLSPRRKPMYEYYVQVEMKGDGVGLDSITFDTDVQMSLLSMPELTVGANRVRYVDETKGPRKVLVTHAWTERTQWHPPVPPKDPVFPQDGATVEGTRFTFRWPAATPLPSLPLKGGGWGGGDAIVDYHIQVCDREDVRWPFSPNFDRITSLTPAEGKPEWTIPFTGLLNPDTNYYWRVRARDNKGVWGAWSRPFRFRVAAPGVPVNVKVVTEGGAPTAIVWEDNPAGRKPVAWRIYGSNEQGFTASDTEYLVRMGRGFCETMQQYKAKTKDDPFFGDVKTPSNFVAETRARRFDLAGPVCAFYRVAAVDEKGNASGPSDFVELPRPFIYTAPVARARVGQGYVYRPAATFSLGQLTCRDGYNASFWGRERLTWTLDAGPPWLKLREGELVGTPAENDAGTCDVVLKVVNNKEGSAEQRFKLVVEK